MKNYVCILLLGLLLGCASTPPSGHIPPGRISNITIGMTKEQVISAIGPQQTVPIPADSTKTNGLWQIVAAPDLNGKLVVGGPADLVLLDEHHKVLKTMRAGKWVGGQR